MTVLKIENCQNEKWYVESELLNSTVLPVRLISLISKVISKNRFRLINDISIMAVVERMERAPLTIS